MSNRYKGGVISATPPTTTGGNDGVASGAWTLEQQMQLQAAGLWPNQPVYYIEDVFSTYLYTGNGSAQTITNSINLSGKGGLVWLKNRGAIGKHQLYDTVRGVQLPLDSGATDAQSNYSPLGLSAFSTTGFSLGSGLSNNNTNTYASWTFRKQPKFFDIVTYTGTGSARTIAHNLGSAPGCIIVKNLTTGGFNWPVYHRSTTAAGNTFLNLTQAYQVDSSMWNSTEPTSTVFSLGANGNANSSGDSYVAYLFAHNAGGFGLTGTDNVISCGSFTTDASGNATVNLGYEPQWVMLKKTSAGDEVQSGHWWMQDNMRGYPVRSSASPYLQANSTGAEQPGGGGVLTFPTATGFQFNQTYAGFNSTNFIYVAVRRGPMKVPTTGTSVLSISSTANTYTYPTANFQNDPKYASDLLFSKRTDSVKQNWWSTRLTGLNQYAGGEPGGADGNLKATPALNSTATTAEESTSVISLFSYAPSAPSQGPIYASVTDPYSVLYGFKRAPSFMDVVCYSGTGVAKTETHNLQAVPELMIVKSRAGTGRDWAVYTSATAATNFMYLNGTDASGASSSMWNDTTPTSSVFTVGTNIRTNNSGQTYVAYLFATLAGVSKVGSYTGTGTTLQVDCGFTGGSRFVLIKRTDSTGDWYVWDSARGIVAGNDPYLLLNSTAAAVTNTDYVDTYNAGFEITSTAPAGINANGGTYIFLAIA